jgi:hypothetical protein
MDIDWKELSRAKEVTPYSSLSYHICRELHFGVKQIAYKADHVKNTERPPRRVAAAFW